MKSLFKTVSFAFIFIYIGGSIKGMGIEEIDKVSEKTRDYVESVQWIEHRLYPVKWDESRDEYTISDLEGNFKVMQLTDLHIAGTKECEDKDLKAFRAMYDLIAFIRPDIIIVTGDLVYPIYECTGSSDNMASFRLVCRFFENVGIPWAFTFGNHDTESSASYSAFQLMDEGRKYSKCFIQKQSPIGGRNNLIINIADDCGGIKNSLILMDSGQYVKGGYGSISEEQITWYKRHITEISKREGHIVPSMMFFHIPIYEWPGINLMLKEGSPDVKYHYGRIREAGGMICASKYKNSIMEAIMSLRSTKAVFVGHDHMNDLSVEYKGVRFTYGKSIDYLAYYNIENSTAQRGATIINIDERGEAVISSVKLSDIEDEEQKVYID